MTSWGVVVGTKEQEMHANLLNLVSEALYREF